MAMSGLISEYKVRLLNVCFLSNVSLQTDNCEGGNQTHGENKK